jgi:hypothetical protein
MLATQNHCRTRARMYQQFWGPGLGRVPLFHVSHALKE